MEQANKKAGFIKLIVLLVLVLILLGYFGFDVKGIVSSPLVHDNLQYVWNLAVNFWNNYLLVPATFIWDKVIVGIIWESIQKLAAQLPTPAQ